MPGSPESGREKLNELSVERAAKLLFLSFRFSQGKEDSQEYIFLWLHLNYPDYRVLEENYQTILNRSAQMANNFFKNIDRQLHVHIDTNRITANNKMQLENMQKLFAAESLNEESWPQLKHPALTLDDVKKILEKEKPILPGLVKFLIDSDRKHMRLGRARHIDYQSNKTETDPRASFLVDYGLLGKPTGAPEYDSMFSQVKAYIKSLKDSKDPNSINTMTEVERVVNFYNHHHPGKNINLDQVLSK